MLQAENENDLDCDQPDVEDDVDNTGDVGYDDYQSDDDEDDEKMMFVLNA